MDSDVPVLATSMATEEGDKENTKEIKIYSTFYFHKMGTNSSITLGTVSLMLKGQKVSPTP